VEEDPVSAEEESIELDESDDSPIGGESPPRLPLSSSILDDRLRFEECEECAQVPRRDEVDGDAVKLTVGICFFHRADRSVEVVSESDTGEVDVGGGTVDMRLAVRRVDFPDRFFRDANAACCLARTVSYSARCLDDNFSKSASDIR